VSREGRACPIQPKLIAEQFNIARDQVQVSDSLSLIQFNFDYFYFFAELTLF